MRKNFGSVNLYHTPRWDCKAALVKPYIRDGGGGVQYLGDEVGVMDNYTGNTCGRCVHGNTAPTYRGERKQSKRHPKRLKPLGCGGYPQCKLARWIEMDG